MTTVDQQFSRQYGKTHGRYSYDYEKTGVVRIPLPIMNDTDLSTDESSVTATWVAPEAGSVIGVYCDLDSGGISADDEATLTVELTKDAGLGAVSVFTANPTVHWDDDAYTPEAAAAVSFGTNADDATGITAGVLKTDGTEDFNRGDTFFMSAIFDEVTAIDTTPYGLRVYALVEYTA